MKAAAKAKIAKNGVKGYGGNKLMQELLPLFPEAPANILNASALQNTCRYEKKKAVPSELQSKVGPFRRLCDQFAFSAVMKVYLLRQMYHASLNLIIL